MVSCGQAEELMRPSPVGRRQEVVRNEDVDTNDSARAQTEKEKGKKERYTYIFPLANPKKGNRHHVHPTVSMYNILVKLHVGKTFRAFTAAINSMSSTCCLSVPTVRKCLPALP